MARRIKMNSYTKVNRLGHREIERILDDEVVLEEKIDGSQFSMQVVDDKLICKSKNADIYLDNPPKMFVKAVETAKKIKNLLSEGYIYRCEYLSKPKHNTLNYSRVPKGNLVLFDVMVGEGYFMSPADKWAEAKRLGLEPVPVFYEGKIKSTNEIEQYLAQESVLGGTKIEGVVVKNYHRFKKDGKFMAGKMVSNDFVELHQRDWKTRNPTRRDIVRGLINELATDARYEKAVQHLKERGVLMHSVKDIGALIKEVKEDIVAEESDYIKQRLYTHFIDAILRGASGGVPNWYKAKLDSDK